VECRSCKGAHRYTRPKSAPKVTLTGTKKKATPRKAADKPTTPVTSKIIEQRWDDLMVRFVEVEERPYNIKTVFEPGDAIRHTQFGLGFVVEKILENRIKVLFRDAERTLVTGFGY